MCSLPAEYCTLKCVKTWGFVDMPAFLYNSKGGQLCYKEHMYALKCVRKYSGPIVLLYCTSSASAVCSQQQAAAAEHVAIR